MVCDVCKEREAIVVVQQISNNQKKEIHLCMICATEKGLIPTQENIGKTIGNLFTKKEVPADNRICPVCGFKISKMKMDYSVGCPECYSVFSSDIQDFFKGNKITESYTGRMTERLANFRSVLTDRLLLQSKLEKSIEQEDYEKAAIYRDRLKALEKCSVADGETDFNGEFV